MCSMSVFVCGIFVCVVVCFVVVSACAMYTPVGVGCKVVCVMSMFVCVVCVCLMYDGVCV